MIVSLDPESMQTVLRYGESTGLGDPSSVLRFLVLRFLKRELAIKRRLLKRERDIKRKQRSRHTATAITRSTSR